MMESVSWDTRVVGVDLVQEGWYAILRGVPNAENIIHVRLLTNVHRSNGLRSHVCPLLTRPRRRRRRRRRCFNNRVKEESLNALFTGKLGNSIIISIN